MRPVELEDSGHWETQLEDSSRQLVWSLELIRESQLEPKFPGVSS